MDVVDECYRLAAAIQPRKSRNTWYTSHKDVRDPKSQQMKRARHVAFWLSVQRGEPWAPRAREFGVSKQTFDYGVRQVEERRMDDLIFQAHTDAARYFIRGNK